MTSLSDIAFELEQEAEWLPDVPDSEEKFEKSFGSFKVRCYPTRIAVEEMAKKFRKKTRFTTRYKLKAHSTMRKYDPFVFDDFVLDDELLNAIFYNLNHDKEVLFSAARGKCPDLLIIKRQMVGEGYMVGRAFYLGEMLPWNVFHLDTGMTCGCAAEGRDTAIKNFKKLNREDLEQAIENSGNRSGFQQRALDRALKVI